MGSSTPVTCPQCLQIVGYSWDDLEMHELEFHSELEDGTTISRGSGSGANNHRPDVRE